MIEAGVQTWGTDTAALRRYWALADDLGYARITYGDGLGAWTLDGWTARGWARHGILYPSASVRVAMVEEATAIVRDLWAGRRVDRAGPHWRLAGATLAPPPVQEPWPPVWIAAMGRRALAAVARCADGWEASSCDGTSRHGRPSTSRPGTSPRAQPGCPGG